MKEIKLYYLQLYLAFQLDYSQEKRIQILEQLNFRLY
jgi:hypothetical protein